ncbi:MAG: transketolase C-terminal domain-containing protein [Verrucomicrobiota bacterium]
MEWHQKELRQVYGETLVSLAATNARIIVLEADLMKASGTSVFKQAFPERFIDVGVSEANMIGIAAGLSNLGKIPFCASFAPFVTRRVYDQATISVAYAKRNVKIVGTAPGITTGPNGGTHMCFQDLAIMRVMPNMTVLSPADAYELRAMLKWMTEYDGPVYMQLIRSREPQLFSPDYRFNPNRAVRLADGNNVTMVSTGYMTKFAKEAARQLCARNIHVDHLHFPVIKPFDNETLLDSAGKTGCVVTIENQSILGGLGGTVCEVLSEKCPTRVRRLGVPDLFGEVASEKYLLSKHHFDVADIISAVEEFL